MNKIHMKTATPKKEQFYCAPGTDYLRFNFIFCGNLNNFAASYTKN
jgi:hypothetical protein